MFYKPITILCLLCYLLLNLQAYATKDLVATSTTESQRAMDHQRGIDFNQNEDDHSTYSQNFGNAVARYYGYALSSYGSGYGSAKINNPSSINQNYYASNNKEFSRLDKQKGANRINLFDPYEPTFEGGHDFTADYSMHLNADFSGAIREFLTGYRELYIGGHGDGNKVGTRRGVAYTPEELYEKFIKNDSTWKKGRVIAIHLAACSSANYAQEPSNLIYTKTGRSVVVYGTKGEYGYSPIFFLPNIADEGMEKFKPNIQGVKNEK